MKWCCCCWDCRIPFVFTCGFVCVFVCVSAFYTSFISSSVFHIHCILKICVWFCVVVVVLVCAPFVYCETSSSSETKASLFISASSTLSSIDQEQNLVLRHIGIHSCTPNPHLPHLPTLLIDIHIGHNGQLLQQPKERWRRRTNQAHRTHRGTNPKSTATHSAHQRSHSTCSHSSGQRADQFVERQDFRCTLRLRCKDRRRPKLP